MAASLLWLGLATLIALCSAQYTVPTPDLSLLSPQGIRFQITDDPGIGLVAYHYNINKPLPGVGAGDYNVDVNTPQGGYWAHENTAVDVNPGDTVYYWVYVLYNGGGYQKTDLSWIAGDPVTQPPVTCPPCTSTPSPTPKPTGGPTTTRGPTQSPPTGPPGGGPGGPEDGPCSNYPCEAECDMATPPCNGLIFEDTFDNFDLDVWEHEITAGGGGNWEFQYYINNRTNSYVRNGVLYIKPTLTEETFGDGFISSGTLSIWGGSPANLCTGNAWWGCERVGNPTNYINPIQSARVRTVNSFGFTYGKVEVSAKMPVGDWLWPAIWLLPTNNGYGEWPASGEIDIVESRGNLNYRDGSGTSVGVDQMGSAMHWGPFLPYNRYDLTHAAKNLNGDNFGNDFHKYVVEWTPTRITFFIDDEQILNVDPGAGGFYGFGDFANQAPNTNNPWINSPNKMAPFDQDYYIVMNVAVGGTGGYFSDGLTNVPPKPWNDQSPTAPRDFWLAKNQWYPTWNPTVNNGEDAAMKVDYVRVWADGSY